MKTKFIKFYTTGSDVVLTVFMKEKYLQNDGMTHTFSDAKDAQSKSEEDVFIFWDDVAIGAGLVKNEGVA